MRVKLAHHSRRGLPGDVVDVPEGEARRIVASGHGRYEPDDPEPAQEVPIPPEGEPTDEFLNQSVRTIVGHLQAADGEILTDTDTVERLLRDEYHGANRHTLISRLQTIRDRLSDDADAS